MLSADILHPKDVRQTDLDAWREFCFAAPAFRTPLLGPDFAQAVGRVREDAAVAIFRHGCEPAGFFAHHRRPGGRARAIGAPFSDHHALVTGPDLAGAGATLLALANVGAFRFTGLIDPHGLFANARGFSRALAREGHVIAIDQSAEAHFEAVRQANPKRFKNYRRLEHRLERDIGEIAFTGPDTSRDAFELLLAWKREQLHRTGLHDFLAGGWTRALMQDLFGRRDGEFRGVLLTVRAGGRLVAGHFGVRQNGVFHPWIAAADPALSAYSPGHLLLRYAILAMPELGLTRYDLSAGHDHYKAQYANARRQIAEGQVYAASPAGRYSASAAMVWRASGAPRIPGALRLQRRLEHISAVDLSLVARVKGVAGAFAGLSRRAAHMGGVYSACNLLSLASQ